MKSVWKTICSSTSKDGDYDVRLRFTDDGTFVPEDSSCTCLHEVYKGKNRKKICRHIKEALNEETKEKWEKIKNKRKKSII